MKTFTTLVACGIVTTIALSAENANAAINRFEMYATRSNVLPAPSGGTPAGATAMAKFDLVDLGAGEFALDYEITIAGLDTAAYRPDATAADTPDTGDNLVAIHMHHVPLGASANRGTPHVMNILGLPLQGPADIEDDLAVASFDLASLTTVLTGRWNAADVAQTAAMPMAGPRTKPVADYLNELRGGEIFMMLHTTADPTGAIGGTLVGVPEPTTAALLLLGTLATATRRRRD